MEWISSFTCWNNTGAKATRNPSILSDEVSVLGGLTLHNYMVMHGLQLEHSLMEIMDGRTNDSTTGFEPFKIDVQGSSRKHVPLGSIMPQAEVSRWTLRSPAASAVTMDLRQRISMLSMLTYHHKRGFQFYFYWYRRHSERACLLRIVIPRGSTQSVIQLSLYPSPSCLNGDCHSHPG